jgi:hypothetical protein
VYRVIGRFAADAAATACASSAGSGCHDLVWLTASQGREPLSRCADGTEGSAGPAIAEAARPGGVSSCAGTRRCGDGIVVRGDRVVIDAANRCASAAGRMNPDPGVISCRARESGAGMVIASHSAGSGASAPPVHRIHVPEVLQHRVPVAGRRHAAVDVAQLVQEVSCSSYRK